MLDMTALTVGKAHRAWPGPCHRLNLSSLALATSGESIRTSVLQPSLGPTRPIKAARTARRSAAD